MQVPTSRARRLATAALYGVPERGKREEEAACTEYIVWTPVQLVVVSDL